MNLTKAKFDELTHELVELTAEPVRRALSDAGLTASELSKVLLVGGSTRIPAVQDKVKQLTGHAVSYTHLDVYKRQVYNCYCFISGTVDCNVVPFFRRQFFP